MGIPVTRDDVQATIRGVNQTCRTSGLLEHCDAADRLRRPLILMVMRLEDSPDDQKEFDFDAWAAAPIKPTFDACAKAAIESLAISDDDLRSRLHAALFCLLQAGRSQIPPVCQPTFDEIANYVDERVGDEKSYTALRQFTRKLKLKTARRLCRKVVKVYEQAATRRAT
jgi:hypothetical protein